jgi:hypothetical protein
MQSDGAILTTNKLPLITLRDLEDSTVLAIKLNFLEKGQILGSIADVASSRDVAWQQVQTEAGSSLQMRLAIL